MSEITFEAKRGLSLLGDEVGAWMADTTEETLVGSELVTDGDMPSTTNWTPLSSGTSLSIVGGRLRVTYTSGPSAARAYQVITTVIGKTYVFSVDVTAGTAITFNLAASTSVSFGSDSIISSSTYGTRTITFIAASTTTYIILSTGELVATKYTDFDNVSVRLAVPDLSTADNGLSVHGSITKSAVATGADLVGYSSSGGGYLEQPHNSDIDPTTGPLSISGWIEPATSSNENICDHKTSGDAGSSGFLFQYRADHTLLMQTREGALVSNAFSGVVVLDDWASFDVEINAAGTQIDWYINGTLSTSTTVTGRDMSNAVAITRWFESVTLAAEFTGRLALPRIRTIARTAAQIKSIYDKEKHLFTNNTFYTQEGEKYTINIPMTEITPETVDTVSKMKSLDGMNEEAIFTRGENRYKMQTMSLQRNTTDVPRISHIEELMYATRKSEIFEIDLYDEGETIDVSRESNGYTQNRIETLDYLNVGFTVRER